MPGSATIVAVAPAGSNDTQANITPTPTTDASAATIAARDAVLSPRRKAIALMATSATMKNRHASAADHAPVRAYCRVAGLASTSVRHARGIQETDADRDGGHETTRRALVVRDALRQA